MLSRCYWVFTVMLAGCSPVPQAAAVEHADWVDWTTARIEPDLVGIYRGGSSQGTWELKICEDDSIRVTMRAADGTGERTLRGTWGVQGADMGMTDMLFVLHSDDGSAIDPPRMRGYYSPPDTIGLRWPGPAWFVDPPGTHWLFVRAPGSARAGQ